jgi:hypothetical protein
MFSIFSIFKKKTKKEKLEQEYSKLIKESHRLSTINRAQSDKTTAKAHEVLKQIEKLNNQ